MTEKWRFVFDEDNNVVGAVKIISICYFPEEAPIETIDKAIDYMEEQLRDIDDVTEYHQLIVKRNNLYALKEKITIIEQLKEVK